MDCLDQIIEQVKVQREAKARILSAAPRPCAFVVSSGYAVIHRSTYGNTEWRVTLLDEHHDPLSHVNATDFAEAVRWVRFCGADLTKEAPHGL